VVAQRARSVDPTSGCRQAHAPDARCPVPTTRTTRQDRTLRIEGALAPRPTRRRGARREPGDRLRANTSVGFGTTPNSATATLRWRGASRTSREAVPRGRGSTVAGGDSAAGRPSRRRRRDRGAVAGLRREAIVVAAGRPAGALRPCGGRSDLAQTDRPAGRAPTIAFMPMRSTPTRETAPVLAVDSDHAAIRGAVIAFVTERSCRRPAWLLLLGESTSQQRARVRRVRTRAFWESSSRHGRPSARSRVVSHPRACFHAIASAQFSSRSRSLKP